MEEINLSMFGWHSRIKEYVESSINGFFNKGIILEETEIVKSVTYHMDTTVTFIPTFELQERKVNDGNDCVWSVDEVYVPKLACGFRNSYTALTGSDFHKLAEKDMIKFIRSHSSYEEDLAAILHKYPGREYVVESRVFWADSNYNKGYVVRT